MTTTAAIAISRSRGGAEVAKQPPRPACAPASLAWRLLRDVPLAGARNMALDHALASGLRAGEAVLRLYGWSRPTVSLGRNEPARSLYGDAPRLDFVRRPTGGRAVVHWRELTYAVIAPLGAWDGLRAAYVAINEALAVALAGLGAPVAVAGASDGRGLSPGAGPCFRSPTPGELTAGGRKLVGSAQARLGGALLQHGSILLEDDQALLAEIADRGALGRLGSVGPAGTAGSAGSQRPATLRELVGDVSIDVLTEQVAMSLRETFGGTWTGEGYRPSELETSERLEATRYARDCWTWRR